MALDACRECGAKVSTEAQICPHCGIAKPVKIVSNDTSNGCSIVFGLLPIALVLIVAFVISVNSLPKVPSYTSQDWYQGGTLGDKTAIEWQVASDKNKLATCANIFAVFWNEGMLTQSIRDELTEMDDVKPYAQELVTFLDTAFKPEPDENDNRKVYINQSVSETAVIGATMMGWLK